MKCSSGFYAAEILNKTANANSPDRIASAQMMLVIEHGIIPRLHFYIQFCSDSGKAPQMNEFDCNSRRVFVALSIAKEIVHSDRLDTARRLKDKKEHLSDGNSR